MLRKSRCLGILHWKFSRNLNSIGKILFHAKNTPTPVPINTVQHYLVSCYWPGKGVVHAMSLGKSNCTGFISWAALASFWSGVRFSVLAASITISSRAGIGGWGRDFPLLALLLLLFVEEASSSFSFGCCILTRKLSLMQFNKTSSIFDHSI